MPHDHSRDRRRRQFLEPLSTALKPKTIKTEIDPVLHVRVMQLLDDKSWNKDRISLAALLRKLLEREALEYEKHKGIK
jgi:hypothetical protein